MKCFFLPVLIITILAISPPIMGATAKPQTPDYSVDPNCWYDIDGDGKMEWISYYSGSPLSRKLYHFNNDNSGQTLITDIEIPSQSKIYWNNFGREDKIDLLVSRTDKRYNSLIYKIENGSASVLYEMDAPLSRIDYNNDGQSDFWIKNSKTSLREQEVLTFGPKNELIKDCIRIMSPAEFYDYWITHYSSSALSYNFIYRPDFSDPAGSFGDYTHIDLNNDGYIDFIDAESGKYLLNAGNGCFVSESLGGSVLFRDFDGDGVNDWLIYSKTDKTITLFFQRLGKEAQEVKLLSGFACSDYIWVRDFDKDGDIDILVPFNASDNMGNAFLLMFENKGNGTFSKHEYYIEGAKAFLGCADVDADGNYEVVAGEEITDKNTVISLYRLSGLEVATSEQKLFECEKHLYNHSKILIGDPANTDSQALLYAENGWSSTRDYTDLNFYIFEGLNTAPERPDAPDVEYDDATGIVKISWGQGTDKETAPLDLT